jgi:hypothetical protein
MRGGWRRGDFEQKIKNKINEVWGVKEKEYEEDDEEMMMAAEG